MILSQRTILFLSLLALPCALFAQTPDTLFTARQESIPPNDSGGRWLPTAVIITSVSSYPQHIQIFTQASYLDYGLYSVDTVYKIADSGYYLADSIFVYGNTHIRSSTPWKFIDSSYPSSMGTTIAQLDFLLPAHGILRIPIKIQAITQQGPAGDTASHGMGGIVSFSDSAGVSRESGIDLKIRCIEMYSAPFGAWQGSVPRNDSGGRWLPSLILLKSASPNPVNLNVILCSNEGYAYPIDTFWEMADSAFYLADSISVAEGYTHYVSSTPWKYIDSVRGQKLGDNFSASLDFHLSPHGVLRIPILIRAIGAQTYDTASYDMSIATYAPYINGGIIWSSFDLTVRCPYACSGPFVAFDGQPLSNMDKPAVIGQSASYFIGTCLNCPVVETTHASYKLVGEYSDRFTLPVDTIISDPAYKYASIEFQGAPKSPIHDTLISTFTDCWGTITTTTPITAYSTYTDGYQIHQLSPNLTAQFLGRAQANAALVINTSDFPITLRNLQAVDAYDSMDFEVSAPAMIAAHDSDFVTVTLKDNDLYLDTMGTSRSAEITGIIAPYQQELGFQDSTFSFGVSGKINVTSPNYFSIQPLLKHGVHPAGIIFTSSVSSKAGPGTFLYVFGNNDSTTEYFGMPYYDDPHFTYTIGNYVGPGLTLPGYVNPDTGYFSPGIQVLTNFTGDSYHNYYTQLHWPRAIDTVTIDVVALGTDAPPFEDVTPTSPSSIISVWPNPASRIVHIDLGQKSSRLWIFDPLGRIIRRTELSTGISNIDLSDLPPGLYGLEMPALRQAVKLQVIR